MIQGLEAGANAESRYLQSSRYRLGPWIRADCGVANVYGGRHGQSSLRSNRGGFPPRQVQGLPAVSKTSEPRAASHPISSRVVSAAQYAEGGANRRVPALTGYPRPGGLKFLEKPPIHPVGFGDAWPDRLALFWPFFPQSKSRPTSSIISGGSCSIANGLYGQGNTGSIVGTVRDSSGVTVPTGIVTIRNQSSSVPLLPPGTYAVTVRQAGFLDAVYNNVTLDVDQTVRVVRVGRDAGARHSSPDCERQRGRAPCEHGYFVGRTSCG